MIWPNGYYSREPANNILAAGFHTNERGYQGGDKVSAGQALDYNK
jgi:hypothetical protein